MGFGGKSRVANIVWDRFGNVQNFCEPFFGSGAVLLGRPHPPATETVNDLDGYVSNFWRAVKSDPEATAHWADNPVFENDLHARHAWLVGQKESFTAKLEGDPDFYDAKIAGWWAWGLCCWIGSGWCSGNGPWRVINGLLVNAGDGDAVEKKRPHLMHDGKGVNAKGRQLVHAGSDGQGVNRQLVHAGSDGQGVNRQLVHAGDDGWGINRKRERLTGFSEVGVNARPDLVAWFTALSDRLRRVRVCCGHWDRICGESVTVKHGLTGVFLDPPYSDEAERSKNLYRKDCGDVANEVREWAIAQGTVDGMRIALCGYDGEHTMPDNWECLPWKAAGGYGYQSAEGNFNGARERIWFSPNCIKPEPELFTLPKQTP